MEALGAVGSVVGIISLGIQLAQILQKQIDDVQNADSRLVQIVIQIKATAAGLTGLQELLLEDEQAAGDKLFSEGGHRDIAFGIELCHIVFRKIIVLIAKAGKAALALADDFQRKVQQEIQRKGSKSIQLELELSKVEHLLWPWRLPKIDQCLADLDRLKSSLLLILAVAGLAKTKKRRDKEKQGSHNVKNSATWWEGDEEIPLLDDVYYKDKAYIEAEKKFGVIAKVVEVPLTQFPVEERQRDLPAQDVNQTELPSQLNAVPAGPVVKRTDQMLPIRYDIRSATLAAQTAIQSWPSQPNAANTPSVSDLLSLGITLEGYSIEFGDWQSHWVRIPLTQQALQDNVLQTPTSSSRTLWDTFSRMPTYQQRALTKLLETIQTYDYGTPDCSRYNSPTLLALHIRNRRRLKFMENLRALTCFSKLGPSRASVFIIVARIPQDTFRNQHASHEPGGLPGSQPPDTNMGGNLGENGNFPSIPHSGLPNTTGYSNYGQPYGNSLPNYHPNPILPAPAPTFSTPGYPAQGYMSQSPFNGGNQVQSYPAPSIYSPAYQNAVYTSGYPALTYPYSSYPIPSYPPQVYPPWPAQTPGYPVASNIQSFANPNLKHQGAGRGHHATEDVGNEQESESRSDAESDSTSDSTPQPRLPRRPAVSASTPTPSNIQSYYPTAAVPTPTPGIYPASRQSTGLGHWGEFSSRSTYTPQQPYLEDSRQIQPYNPTTNTTQQPNLVAPTTTTTTVFVRELPNGSDTDTGLPPTAKEKILVARYYLKKWTTALDHIKGKTHTNIRSQIPDADARSRRTVGFSLEGRNAAAAGTRARAGARAGSTVSQQPYVEEVEDGWTVRPGIRG